MSKRDDKNSEWMTTGEVSEAVGISKRQVRNKAAMGKLKAKKRGNRWLIHRSLSPVGSETVGSLSEVSEVEAETTVSHETAARLQAENDRLRDRIGYVEKSLSELATKVENVENRLQAQDVGCLRYLISLFGKERKG